MGNPFGIGLIRTWLSCPEAVLSGDVNRALEEGRVADMQDPHSENDRDEGGCPTPDC